QPTDDAADQNEQGKAIVMETQGLVDLFDREGRIGFDLAISFFAHQASGRGESRGVFELGHQAVDRCPHFSMPSATSASGSKVRTSKIEIMGRERMNRKKRKKNRPMVPT